MADETPLAGEPPGNRKIMMIFASAGIILLIIFLLFFSGIFRENVTERGNTNATSTNQGRAVP